MPSYLASEKNDDSPPAPVSCMQQKSLICSQPAVGTDSSDASRPVGAARHSSVGILAPASTEMTWRKPSMAARPCLIHDLVARHVARLDQAEGVVDAQRREDADVTLGEHLDGARAERRRREGVGGLEERKGDDGVVLHDCK